MYQFISDPTHKENLSGRVSAACLNCRRKKIKCSGEPKNCRTCRERGLVCEGPPKRRPPKRGDRSGHASPSSSSTRRQSSDFEGSGQSLPRKNISGSTDDSGSIASGHEVEASSQNHSRFISVPGVVRARSLAGTPDNVPSTCMNLNFEDYHVVEPDQTSLFECRSSTSESGTNSAAISPVNTSFQALERQNYDGWWSGNNNNNNVQSTTHLLSTAQHLEQRAQSLRQMASYQEVDGDYRRQTIAGPATGTHLESWNLPPRAWGSADDTAMMRYDPTNPQQATGLTPSMEDFASWWDVDNSDALFPGSAHDAAHHIFLPPRSIQQETAFLSAGIQQTSRMSPAHYGDNLALSWPSNSWQGPAAPSPPPPGWTNNQRRER